MRLNFRSTTLASVAMSSVLARPGTPTIRLLPPTKRQSTGDDLVLADDELLQFRDHLLPPGVHLVGQRDVIRRFESGSLPRSFPLVDP